jgi:predicted ABC-type sugar transport system permease subunit
MPTAQTYQGLFHALAEMGLLEMARCVPISTSAQAARATGMQPVPTLLAVFRARAMLAGLAMD